MDKELETKQDDPKEEITEQLPPEEPEVKEPEKDPVKELELENAKLKGMLEAKTQPVPQPIQTVDSEQARYQNTKQTVLNDAQALSVEDFEEKYKMSKAEAKVHFTTYELELERAKNAENMAILRAENQVVKKYGEKYSKYQDKIEATIKDLSPSVRQDPQRLAQHMETILKAQMSEERDETPAPKPAKKEGEPMNRKIIDSGFNKPNVVPDDVTPNKSKSDEIEPELRGLAKQFGITSEKERKKFMEAEIDVAYGGGKWFTKNGIETVKS
jgi:hypothetical protein